MQQAHYLNNVVCACTDTSFGQEAIEHAILTNAVPLSGNPEQDVRFIMHRYDNICAAYRTARDRHEASDIAPFHPPFEQQEGQRVA